MKRFEIVLNKVNKLIEDEKFYIKHYEKLSSFGSYEKQYFLSFVIIHKMNLEKFEALKKLLEL